MAMEQHKLRGLDAYLRRINMRVEEAVEIGWSWERRARSCYAKPIINMNSDDFVKMMLVDGCFIVELMITVYGQFTQTQNGLDTSIYKATGIDLYRDLTMLENQLPFFVLQCLFDRFSLASMKGISFVQVTHNFFNNVLIKPCELPVFTQKVNHLVDFLSFYYATSTLLTTSGKNQVKLPPTATELCEAGVVFKQATQGKRLMDISFKDGVLEIPPFEIHDAFETYVRNLMAFEHYPIGNQRYVIDYVAFLDGLISKEKDVHLLVKAEIITNHIGGSDVEISKLFNDLCKEVSIADDFFYFYDVSEALHEHCRARRNKWMASLRRDYFNTPWASISFFAATFLILLTLAQTILSAISLSK